MKGERYLVPANILSETQEFLYARGLEGCEGTLLWIGVSSDGHKQITRILVPEQVCIKTKFGVAVDLTERAHYTLTDSLEPDERFFVRVHSHPERAYHSKRDDENAILTHQGALSVVVPNFAREPIKFSSSAVYRFEHGQGWLELDFTQKSTVFEVVP